MALSDDAIPRHRGAHFDSELGVAASQDIKGGMLLVVDTSTLVVSAAHQTSGLVFVGVATEGKDNSSGADDDLTISLSRNNSVLAMPTTGAIVYGDLVYVHDNEKVAASGTLTGAPGNSPGVRVGIALEPHESLVNTSWVLLDPTA